MGSSNKDLDFIKHKNLSEVKVKEKKRGFFRKKLKTVNDEYDKMNKEVVNMFNPAYYDEPPTPPSENITLIKDEDGEIITVSIKPTMTSPWMFEYYLPPLYKAQLISSVVIFCLMFLAATIGTFLSSTINWFGIALCSFLFIAIFFNGMKYFGMGIAKLPIPDLPFMPIVVGLIPVPGSFEALEIDDDDEGYEEEGYEEYLEPIKQVSNRRNGVESPATILTTWMNSPDVLWDEDELIRRSGNIFNTRIVRALINDNMGEWRNEDNIRTLSKITNSSVNQWNSVVEDWINEA